MSTLFIDTTKFITIGLLDNEFKWLDYSRFDELKASAAVHFKIYEVLKKHNLQIEELEQIIYMAGPGSYTGMRVSEGMADVFKMARIPVYSFYHFQVPTMLNIESGIWKSDAFKNEVFLYQWDREAYSQRLIKKEEDKFSDYYCSFNNIDTIGSTDLMIKDKSSIILKLVVEKKLKEKLYYYRSIDDEYKVQK